MSNAQSAAVALELEIAAFKRRGILLNAIVLFPFVFVFAFVATRLFGTEGLASFLVTVFCFACYVAILVLQRKLREQPSQVRRAALARAVIRLWVQSADSSSRELRDNMSRRVSADKLLQSIPASFLEALLKAEREQKLRRAKAASVASPKVDEPQDVLPEPLFRPGPFSGQLSGNGLPVDEYSGVDSYGDGVGQRHHDPFGDNR